MFWLLHLATTKEQIEFNLCDIIKMHGILQSDFSVFL